MNNAYEAFFNSGLELEKNPLIRHNYPLISRNLGLKSALLAAVLWIAALIANFYNPPLCHFLLILTYFLAGTEALIESLEDLIHLRINIDVLMTLAAFLSALIGSPLEGALLLVLFAISESMESAVEHKTTAAIESLIELSPTQALVVDEGRTITKSARDIAVGTHILIQPGATVPLDGKVIDGTSSLSTAHLTGEPLPIARGPGDPIAAGSVNGEGSLTLEVTATSSNSTISRIINLITEAQDSKPKLQRLFDRFIDTYAKTIIALAALFGGVAPLLSNLPYLGEEGAIYRALAFLIASSPCALIIAIPTAYLSAISSCAKKGVLLKGGTILDQVAKAKIFVFDKTGTLTKAQLSLAQIHGASDPKEALAAAAAIEQHSSHPIAAALVAAAQEQKLTLPSTSNVREIPGFGIEGSVDGKGKGIGKGEITIGHTGHITSKLPEKIRAEAEAKIQEISSQGESLCAMLQGESVTIFTFRDTIKEDAKASIDALHAENLHVAMLTGDHAAAAQATARDLGIDEIYADLRPEDKMAQVAKLEKKAPVAMFGDGINDAPALARASVGISMGDLGSDTAIEASDIVFLHDELMLGPWVISKAKATMRIVKQNLCFAIGVIGCVSLLALFGFVPLWLAVMLHEGGTILVALNGLRLIRA